MTQHDPHQCDCEAARIVKALAELSPNLAADSVGHDWPELLAIWQRAKAWSEPEHKPQTLFGKPIVYRNNFPAVDVQLGTLTREVAAKAVGYVCPKCGRGVEESIRPAVKAPCPCEPPCCGEHYEAGPTTTFYPCGCEVNV